MRWDNEATVASVFAQLQQNVCFPIGIEQDVHCGANEIPVTDLVEVTELDLPRLHRRLPFVMPKAHGHNATPATQQAVTATSKTLFGNMASTASSVSQNTKDR